MSRGTSRLSARASPNTRRATRCVRTTSAHNPYLSLSQVAAFTKMRQADPRWGAYQEYSTAPLNTVFPLGPRTTFEEAATLPLAVGTAFTGLYRRLRIPPFTDTSKPLAGEPVVIYGASSSVGSYAVQLAKLSGMYVVGIAGSSADVALGLGADKVVDYRGRSREEVVKDVQAALEGRPLHHVCESECR